ncbi:probable F-box protein At2g36090 [Gastrolobium bilobum]|uniref:probable F-box protein At2g36090 n=1 Tax=Gastrolobium bilobum TaxID=150636 RepID=UPI002AB2B2AC|nr:probable F-box protein At2g36090 [Gastrolobium bilobum]
MACTPGEITTAATTISAVHPDVILTHILTRLDGAALASAASTCSQLRALSSHEHLWVNACHSTWPSTRVPRVRHVISTFPNGFRSFFADSFTGSRHSTTATAPINPDHTPELISAVDLFHRQRLVFSNVLETETGTGWFRCSPFRVDMVGPKDAVRTPVKYPVDEDTCRDLSEELRLSWIVIDPAGRRAMNVSSWKAVSVRRHWLIREVEVQFGTVVSGERGTASEAALCSAVVTWGGAEGGEMHVREMSLQMEDMDGIQLNGRDSLVILQRALEGKRGRARNEDEGYSYSNGYREFMKRKKERKVKKVKAEEKLDMICIVLVAFTFACLFGLFVFCR